MKILPTPASKSNGASDGLFGNRRFEFENNQSDEEGACKEEETVVATESEKKMMEVLERRRQEIVAGLLDRLGRGNRDFESTLNAHSTLLEMTDNEQVFGKLVES